MRTLSPWPARGAEAEDMAAAAGGNTNVSGESKWKYDNGVFSHLSPRDPVNFPAPQAGLMPPKGR